MSKQDIDAFLDRLTEQDAFRQQVGEALQGCQDVAAAAVDIARGAGFEFTAQEFDQALSRRYGTRELSDADLDQVSAGGVTVGVNMLSVAHKSSSGVTIAFPDVCKTPSPADPIPVPYPNIGISSDSDAKGTKSTKGG